MKDSQFSYITFNYRRNSIFDFSRKGFLTESKEFNLEKYQKFTPKNTENYYYKKQTLKGAENKVKNLLSNFLKNYENEGHPLIYNKLNKAKTKKKNK